MQRVNLSDFVLNFYNSFLTKFPNLQILAPIGYAMRDLNIVVI